jgi:hypothetical protein
MTAITVLMASVAQAGILIDYVGNPDSANHLTEINDGDFSSAGTGSPWVPPTISNNLSFKNNRGFDTGTDINIVVGDGHKEMGAIDIGQTYTLGDQFEAAFSWTSAAAWGDLDEIVFSLYYTDTDAIGGIRTTIASFASGGRTTAKFAWESETFGLTTALADAGLVGKNLYALMATDLTVDQAGLFARVDNVYLSSIPEANTYALLAGLTGLTFVMLRRRRG